jgi:hypothetical protein
VSATVEDSQEPAAAESAGTMAAWRRLRRSWVLPSADDSTGLAVADTVVTVALRPGRATPPALDPPHVLDPPAALDRPSALDSRPAPAIPPAVPEAPKPPAAEPAPAAGPLLPADLASEPGAANWLDETSAPAPAAGTASPPPRFAAAQQAGLAAAMRIASAPGAVAAVSAPPAPVAAPPTLPVTRPASGHRQANRSRRAATPAPGRRRRGPDQQLAALPGRLVLVAILTVQAVLSARLIASYNYTVFNDEGLYLWAGRLEWSHLLHGAAVPPFEAYFSGAPIIYPPIGALAASVGGVTGARVLSLCFMLGASCLLWSTASRLYGRRVAALSTGLWAVLGPTQHLGAYATYDAMTLFLIALAAWCATGRRDSDDATGWILAAAGILAVANATKYASAIFDPVVIGLSVLSAWPRPGGRGKVALRRGTLMTAVTVGLLALLIKLGGPLYSRGLAQTTLSRNGNTSPMLTVLAQSWGWVGVVAVLAAAGVVLSWRRPNRLLTLLLAAAIVLVPAEQARIHTTTSLNKHVDFGAWFAAMAAGYAISALLTLLRPRLLRVSVACACVLGLGAAAQVGAYQADHMLFGYWPNEARLAAALRPLTAHGGNFLAEDQGIPAYFLPDTHWQQWSNTRSVRTPHGQVVAASVGGQGNPAVYRRLIAEHYFSVIMLTGTDTVALDADIAQDVQHTSGYRLADTIPFGSTRGGYSIWVYQPPSGHQAR